MKQLRYQDVFTPGGFPVHTYNPRAALGLEGMVREVTKNLCKLVTVTGQTKSGKTVLVRRILPREDSIWIDGGVVSVEDDFWQVVIDQLDLFQSVTRSESQSSTATLSADGTAGANLLFAKGNVSVGGELEGSRESGTTSSKLLSSRVVALRALGSARVPLVVDDFHYLPKDLQGSVVRALKPLIFDGVPVVLIAIPHRRYDAIKVEKEMTGRMFPVTIPSWEESELQYIADKGFAILEQRCPSDISKRMISEAIGSPHLMQDFCRSVCKGMNDVSEVATLTTERLETVFRDVAETIGRPIFEKLARGPRQRSDRLQRELKDGSTVDIYQLVLHGLAYLRPGLISIEYEQLRSAIKDVSASQAPQLHEVARVLKHMSTIAASDQSSTPVIDFEEQDKKLHITDPFFAFYLRWGRLDS